MVTSTRHCLTLTGLILTALMLGACTQLGYGELRPRDGADIIPTTLRDGSVQTGSGTVTVRRGDTVYGIARAHGVELRSLISANNMKAPYLLRIGEVLKLPQPHYYVVKRGDTGYGISRKFGIDLTTLVRMNGMKRPYRLRVGQRLKLPAGAREAEVRVASASSSSGGKTPKTTVPEPPARSGRGFLWPVNGKILSSFGPKEGGLHNDGINIKTPQGAEIRAAEAGVVAYAGDELRGYGNLLLIRHDGGWITAYAHNEKLMVSRGDRVSRGQVIASAGSTGGVRDPQLHFEIRKGRQAVDPLNYLPKSGKNAP